MKKNFVLDTNVLLHDPRSILSFEENNVIIPIYVIEEVDNFKKDLSELGRNARAVGRMIDGFRATGRLNEGVTTPTGGSLRVVFTNRVLPAENCFAIPDSMTLDQAAQIEPLYVGL